MKHRKEVLISDHSSLPLLCEALHNKGALVGDDLSHTLATENDQTIVTLTEDAQWWDGSDQAGTLTGTSNNQLMPDKGRLQCVIEPAVECMDMRQVEVQEVEIAPTLIATDYKGGKAVGLGRDVFNQGQNAKYGMSLSEDVQPTLTSRGPGAVCFENHLSDARLKEVPVSPTVMSRWGTGGNQTPLVMDDVQAEASEVTPVGFIKNDAGGEQQGFWGDTFPTLRSGALPAVAYNVSFCDTNGTRKDRPDGGLYVTEADASKTVTAGGTNAETVVVDSNIRTFQKISRAHGKDGLGERWGESEVAATQNCFDQGNSRAVDIVVDSVAIAENIIGRQDHTGGNGVGAQEELAYTQNATGVMGVATMECVPLDIRNATRDPDKKDEQNRQGVGVGEDGAPMNTITSASVPGVGWQSTVRKLLPVECERLMGFPDNHTRIKWKGKPEEECPDAPRYKACGNSMCVNVMAWIGHRIQAVEERISPKSG